MSKDRGNCVFEIIPWCPYCSERFSSPTGTKHEKGKLECEFCKKEFEWESEITISTYKISAEPQGKD